MSWLWEPGIQKSWAGDLVRSRGESLQARKWKRSQGSEGRQKVQGPSKGRGEEEETTVVTKKLVGGRGSGEKPGVQYPEGRHGARRRKHPRRDEVKPKKPPAFTFGL